MSNESRRFPTTKSFELLAVRVTSERYKETNGYNIVNMVSELNLYEHLDKPFISGNMIVADPAGGISITNTLNIKGTEKLLIKIKTGPRESNVNGDPLEIEKNFVITEIISQKKSNDRSEAFVIRFVEDSAYKSALINLNRSYNGTMIEIINEILSDELNRRLLARPDGQYQPFQDKLTKLTIPNLQPLNAVNWIKDRLTTEKGLPFYLFSSIGDDHMRLLDLETMLEGKATNENLPPYVYGAASPTSGEAGTGQGVKESFNIIDYESNRSENTLELAERGYLTGRYNFIDTTTGEHHKVDFDVLSVYRDLINRGILSDTSIIPGYDFEAAIDDQTLNQYTSREITVYNTSHQYNDYEIFGSYHEARSNELNRNRIVARSLRYWLHKSPMTIKLPGKNFLKKNSNMTLGNKINVLFLNSSSNTDNVSDMVDRKKSGSYLINSARHTFIGSTSGRDGSSYTVNLNLIRLGGSS